MIRTLRATALLGRCLAAALHTCPLAWEDWMGPRGGLYVVLRPTAELYVFQAPPCTSAFCLDQWCCCAFRFVLHHHAPLRLLKPKVLLRLTFFKSTTMHLYVFYVVLEQHLEHHHAPCDCLRHHHAPLHVLHDVCILLCFQCMFALAHVSATALRVFRAPHAFLRFVRTNVAAAPYFFIKKHHHAPLRV